MSKLSNLPTLPNRDAQTSRKQKVDKPRNKKNKVTPQASDTLSKPKKRVTGSKNKKVPPSEDTFVHSTAFIPSRYRYNSATPDWQRQACQQLGLEFVRKNGITLGGPNVALCPPTRVHWVEGDWNCLFYFLCYIITGSIREHLTLRSLIVQHLRTHIGCWRLLPNFIDQDQSIGEYI